MDVRVILVAMWHPRDTRLALVANGAILDPVATARRLKDFSDTIAVDGGLIHCHEMEVTPSLITGDFDSAPLELLEKYKEIPRIEMPDQNQTDLAKTLSYLHSFSLTQITIFAGLGNRIDHTLKNISLLSHYPGKVILETEKERLFVIDQETHLSCEVGQTLSLLPLNGEAEGVTTQGLKWELHGESLHKYRGGISNVALQQEVSIRCEKGDLLVMIR